MRVNHLGVLRNALLLFGIVLALLAPETQQRTVLAWPAVMSTLIAPALAPLVFMVIFLDTMMVAIFSAGTDSATQKRRYRKIIIINAAVAILVVFRWLPFFMALGRA